MLGGIGSRRRRGWQRMRWLNGITESMDMSLSERRELVMDRESWRAVIYGVTKSRERLSNWTELILWWRRIRGLWKLPDLRDWLRRKLALVLMEGAMLSSVQFSHSVMSESLQPHESQHARPPCPSPTPGVHSNSCPSSWWCHLRDMQNKMQWDIIRPHKGVSNFQDWQCCQRCETKGISIHCWEYCKLVYFVI